MDRAFLEELGLTVTERGGVVEAHLPLTSGQAFNPLTRKGIEAVHFTVVGDRLLYVGPPEFIGSQPINLAFLTPGTTLETLVVQTLNDHLFQLERRSKELSALGINPRVEPRTLTLAAEFEREGFVVAVGAGRNGQFRVTRASNQGHELSLGPEATVFELSEFRERSALEDFVFALFGDLSPSLTRPAPPQVPAGGAGVITFHELLAAFGDASLPARSALEMVCELSVRGQVLRFAAARVQGRTFRGLLAGGQGKLWADRFELDGFPGIRAKVAEVMRVPVSEVEVLGS